jgi:hypothetical protein
LLVHDHADRDQRQQGEAPITAPPNKPTFPISSIKLIASSYLLSRQTAPHRPLPEHVTERAVSDRIS